MTTIRGAGVHTLPNPNGKGWVNQIRGIKIADAPFRFKADAEAAGRTIAQQLATEHTIHRANGRIAARTSYGDDDYPYAPVS